jgi:hypothetical protein
MMKELYAARCPTKSWDDVERERRNARFGDKIIVNAILLSGPWHSRCVRHTQPHCITEFFLQLFHKGALRSKEANTV